MRQNILLILITFLASCTTTEYKYTPPKTQEGVSCVTQCQEYQQECKRYARNVADNVFHYCQERSTAEYHSCQRDAHHRFQRCEMREEAEYVACLKYANTHHQDKHTCAKKPCKLEQCQQESCYHRTDDYHCENEFNACFQQCGGTITIIEH